MKRLLLFCVLSGSAAAEYESLEWSTLAPAINEPRVILPEVNDTQKRMLGYVLQLQSKTDEASIADVNKIKSTLKKQGIDADIALQARANYMMLEQRKAESLNTTLNGQKVRLSGFVVPIKFAGIKAVEFLFLPHAGACIHMPPPAANQVIKLQYSQGFEVNNVQYPVWVEGTIKADLRTERVELVDGEMPVTMGYMMEGVSIEHYYSAQSKHQRQDADTSLSHRHQH
ncbi:Conserved hypothetical protein [Shewanella piezotolerans WP3]|uniref:Lipoprotein n=2 Tax=Shewanella TaxID=22 RepID=B8CS58_SHEPW|nr:Conserved hypothetical protein [Shewanella piezotolerans WP3]